MQCLKRGFTILTLLLLPLSAFSTETPNRLQMNMLPGVTPISRDIYDLHMTILGVVTFIAIAVFSVLIYALIKHRKSKGHKSASFHENTWVEIIWTTIPFIILIGMAIPATLVLMRMHDDAKSELNIKIIGYQWKWKYEYLDQGISFFSNLSTPPEQIANKVKKNKWYLLEVDKPLVVPIHTKIRFLVTSNDVIHSWWVPELGIKRDAIPGFVHEAWARIDKPGVYRGQCAELCGVHHAYMPIVVVAKTKAEFEAWVAEQQAGGKKTTSKKKSTTPLSKAQLMTLGKKTYIKTCSVCHKPSGEGMPPAFPAIKGGKISTGPLKAHIDIVLHGKAGTAMQAFKEQLSDEDLAAVITYQRNTWGNNNQGKYGKHAGGLVQPAQIAKAK